MKLQYLTEEALEAFIVSALREDIGDGDHTTLATIPSDAQDEVYIVAKESGIIAGIELAKIIYAHLDDNILIDALKNDGDSLEVGDVVMNISGNARSLLTGERLVLNCMQRMSGIATKTRNLVDLIKDYPTQLLDTRKTGPNFRIIEKWAVAIGGGRNHRFGLYDMIMIKDNHVDFAGGIAKAIQAAKSYLEDQKIAIKIEVETRDLDEVRQVLKEGGVDVIMLDNMTPELMSQAVSLIDGQAKTEASGNINEKTIEAAAKSGVDFISMGALTHSYKSVDLSMKVKR